MIIVSQGGDDGIDDSRSVILGRLAQKGMVEDLEPME
jgi:hypothetical protein